MLLRLLAVLLALVVPASAATRLNVAIGADVNVVEVHTSLLGPGFKAQVPDVELNVVGTGTGEPDRGGEDGHELEHVHVDVSFHEGGKTRNRRTGTLISTAPGLAGAGPSTSWTESPTRT